MARICGRCRKAPRGDDPMGAMFFPVEMDPQEPIVCGAHVPYGPGVYDSCAACKAQITGQPYEPPRYERGTHVPTKPSGGNIEICGVCRLAMYEDDSPTAMRLSVREIMGGGPMPGVYQACRDCVAKYAPAILARLIKDGDLPASIRLESMPRNALL